MQERGVAVQRPHTSIPQSALWADADGPSLSGKVGHRGTAHPARERVWLARQSGEDSVSAVAVTHDADPPWRCVVFTDGPFPRIEQVVQHLAAPLTIAGVQVCLAITGRASEVDLENRVATVREPLDLGIEAPHIPLPRSAMHEQDHGSLLPLAVTGEGQIPVKPATVACEELNRLHGRKTISSK